MDSFPGHQRPLLLAEGIAAETAFREPFRGSTGHGLQPEPRARLCSPPGNSEAGVQRSPAFRAAVLADPLCPMPRSEGHRERTRAGGAGQTRLTDSEPRAEPPMS